MTHIHCSGLLVSTATWIIHPLRVSISISLWKAMPILSMANAFLNHRMNRISREGAASSRSTCPVRVVLCPRMGWGIVRVYPNCSSSSIRMDRCYRISLMKRDPSCISRIFSIKDSSNCSINPSSIFAESIPYRLISKNVSDPRSYYSIPCRVRLLVLWQLVNTYSLILYLGKRIQLLCLVFLIWLCE